ncbi:hypothetical protein AAHZ94_34345, partial [Streptomyces sp. HSW2009]|uniref:hypothetical protein n=1 Tax=Streptomyces sp. HSW2009 TaxID=3142890 RepID=UPI0032EEB9DA
MRFVSRPVGAVVLVAGLAALAAPADGSSGEPPRPVGRLSVSPVAAHPDEPVELRVWGCDAAAGTAASAAFARDAALVPSGRGGAGLRGDALIRAGAGTGTYDLTVRCDGTDRVAAARVRVTAAERESSAEREASADRPVRDAEPVPPAAHPRPVRSPIAPVRAGGGGTADERRAAAERERDAAADGPARADGIGAGTDARADARGEQDAQGERGEQDTRDERDERAAPRRGLGGVEAYGLALAGGTALTLGGLALRRRSGRAGRPPGGAARGPAAGRGTSPPGRPGAADGRGG